MRVLVVLALILAGGAAHAEPLSGAVALLPLDADHELELYGQPVASEIASALVAGGIKVVVVGPKMAVPEGARLVIDGTIKAGKGDAVTLSVRVRDPRDGTVIDTLVVTAASHLKIDQAAEELSGRVLPSVRGRLATVEPPADSHVEIKHPARVQAPAIHHPMLATVVVASGDTAMIRAAFGAAVDPWAQRRHHDVKLVEPTELVPETASKQVNAAGADLAVMLEVQDFTVEPGPVPTARATVRVRVADPGHVVFDRVIVTDTVVGDRGLATARLAERVARQVLEIIEPHVKRSVASWR